MSSDYSQWFDPKAGRTSNAGWESFGPQDLMALYEQYLKMTMQAENEALSRKLAMASGAAAQTGSGGYARNSSELNAQKFENDLRRQYMASLVLGASGGGGGGGSIGRDPNLESSPAELPSDWRFGPSATAAQNNMMTSLGNSGGVLGQAGTAGQNSNGVTTVAPQSENTSILDFIRKFYPTGSQWVQNYLPEKPLYGPRR